MHRRNRTPCTFRADKGEKKKSAGSARQGGGGGGWGRIQAGGGGNGTCLLVTASMAKQGREPGPPGPKQAKTSSFMKPGQTRHERLTATQDVLRLPPHPPSHLPAGHHLPLLPRANTALTDLPKKPNWKEEGSREGARTQGRKALSCGRVTRQGWIKTGRPRNGNGQACVHFPPNTLNSFICRLTFTLQELPPNHQILETCFSPGVPHLTLPSPSWKCLELSRGYHSPYTFPMAVKTTGVPSTPRLKIEGIVHEDPPLSIG